MKTLMLSLLLCVSSAAYAQEAVVTGISKAFHQGVSVTVSLEGKLEGLELNETATLGYDLAGRLVKIGDLVVVYDQAWRVKSIGDSALIYERITGRLAQFGEAQLSYEPITGKLYSVGGAKVNYRRIGPANGIIGEVPAGYNLRFGFVVAEPGQ
jgi:hypothetical protein